MKAARWHGRKDVRVDEIPEPKPPPGTVKLKVRYCGICGTDVREYRDGPMFIPTTPHPITGTCAPLTLGHEYGGEIVELGEGVTGWQIGDRVASEGFWSCGTCYWCKRGIFNRCLNLAFHGLMYPGGLAEYVIDPANVLYRLDPRLTWEEACLVEPVAVCVRAVNRMQPQLGERAVIVGGGPIGQAILQVVRAAGILDVMVIEKHRARRELAKKFGARQVIDPQSENPLEAVADFTNGLGADITFECTGGQSGFDTALQATRKGGRMCQVGHAGIPVSVVLNDICVAERTIIGTVAYAGEFATAIELIAAGKVRAQEMITAKVPLDNIVKGGLEELMYNNENHVKIIVATS